MVSCGDCGCVQSAPPYHEVREKVNETIANLTAWSLRHAMAGTAPVAGFSGEEFDSNTFRHEMAGKPLAGGFKLLVLDLIFFN